MRPMRGWPSTRASADATSENCSARWWRTAAAFGRERITVSTAARPLPGGSRRFSTSAHSSTAAIRPATMRAVACLPASASGRSTRLTSAVATAATCMRPSCGST